MLQYDSSGQLVQDTTTVNQLLNIANSYHPVQPDSSTAYASKALSIAEKINYTKGTLDANYLVGTGFFIKGEHQQALSIANNSLKHFKDDELKRQKALMNQLAGMAHTSIGSYQPGLEYFMKARDLFESLGNKKNIFDNLNNIGVVYLKLKNYEKALDIFLELDASETLEPETISIPVNLGFIYYELGEYDKAEKQLSRVLNFEGPKYDQRALGLSTFKLGEIHRERMEYDMAIDFFEQSMAVFDKMDNELQKVQSLNGIALTYLKANNLDRALINAKKGLAIANSYNAIPQRNNSAETLYKIYDRQGNTEMALKYHKLLKTYSDSMLNDEISKEVGRLEAKNEFEERELALKEQQKQQQLENEKQVAEQRVYLAVLFALLLASLIGGYSFYRNSQVRKKANSLLKEKNREIASQAERLEDLNKVKNQLFSIISHDLRGPISSLQGLINLHEMDELSNEEIEILMPQVAQKFKHTSSLLNNLLSWSRSQLEGYHTEPEDFDIKKLTDEILPIATQKAGVKRIEVKNKIDNPLHVHADRSMIELVLLNLLSNAVKFTPAGGFVELSARQMDDKSVQICVKDTGVGIPDEKLELLLEDENFYSTNGTENEKGTGLGLILCNDFVEKNNGSMEVQSTPDSGSTFSFSLPAAQTRPHQSLQAVNDLG